MKTNFEKVSEMNVAFGNPKGNPSELDWERIEKQARNILDEYDELMEAIKNRDLKEVRDATSDIRVFAYGVDHIVGTNADEDMDAVYVSNMSKFCANDEELEATCKKYTGMCVSYYVRGTFPYVYLKSSHDQISTDGKNFPAHKFLKGVKFQEPVFKDVV